MSKIKDLVIDSEYYKEADKIIKEIKETYKD